jgi:hypothetical protein
MRETCFKARSISNAKIWSNYLSDLRFPRLPLVSSFTAIAYLITVNVERFLSSTFVIKFMTGIVANQNTSCKVMILGLRNCLRNLD